MERVKIVFRSIRNVIRYWLITRKMEKQLQSKDISLISSDCTGGVVYHDLHMPFLSPTINMYMDAPDYLKFIKNINDYINLPLVELPEKSKQEGIPVALLGDIKLHLVHYKSVSQAQDAWNRRKVRIKPERLFFIMNDRNGCTPELIAEFNDFLIRGGV